MRASACIASIFRLNSLYISTHSKDPTWDKTGTVYWSAIEVNVGIICTSMTTLRPLVSRIFPGTFNATPPTPQLASIVVCGEGTSAVSTENGPPSSKSGSAEVVEGV